MFETKTLLQHKIEFLDGLNEMLISKLKERKFIIQSQKQALETQKETIARLDNAVLNKAEIIEMQKAEISLLKTKLNQF